MEKAAALNRVLQRQSSNIGLNKIMSEYERRYGAVNAKTVYTPEEDRASFAQHLQSLSAALEVCTGDKHVTKSTSSSMKNVSQKLNHLKLVSEV